MENNTPEHHQNPTPASRTSTPTTSNSVSPTKPLPPTPDQAPHPPLEPYRDEPSAEPAGRGGTYIPTQHPHTIAPRRYRRHASTHVHLQQHNHFPPYTDVPGSSTNDDDVPLGQLYPYPTEAPPAYAVAVRQSFRETLVQYMPADSNSRAESVHTDEEAGEEREYEYADDVRFSVERIVASFLVAFGLLVLSIFMVAWLIFRK